MQHFMLNLRLSIQHLSSHMSHPEDRSMGTKYFLPPFVNHVCMHLDDINFKLMVHIVVRTKVAVLACTVNSRTCTKAKQLAEKA